jgi:hypothetical protein
MALPTSYLTSVKNLSSILEAIKSAKAPDKFTVRFLESLDFKSVADRLVIGVLKSLGFLDDSGRPKERYFRFLDQTQSAAVLAEGIRDAYADLFQVNTRANTLSKTDVINKFKTLSQGSISESVLDKMAMTFTNLAKLGDFDAKSDPSKLEPQLDQPHTPEHMPAATISAHPIRTIGGLHYNIQIILPDSRDPQVYDALFRSLKEHLFQ